MFAKLGGRPATSFFPINAPDVGRFQLFNLGVLGYGLELRFWVAIVIIISLTVRGHSQLSTFMKAFTAYAF